MHTRGVIGPYGPVSDDEALEKGKRRDLQVRRLSAYMYPHACTFFPVSKDTCSTLYLCMHVVADVYGMTVPLHAPLTGLCAHACG